MPVISAERSTGDIDQGSLGSRTQQRMTCYSTSDAPSPSCGFRLSQKTDGNIHNTIMASASVSEANAALREHPFPVSFPSSAVMVWRCLPGCPDGQGALPHPTDGHGLTQMWALRRRRGTPVSIHCFL